MKKRINNVKNLLLLNQFEDNRKYYNESNEFFNDLLHFRNNDLDLVELFKKPIPSPNSDAVKATPKQPEVMTSVVKLGLESHQVEFFYQ